MPYVMRNANIVNSKPLDSRRHQRGGMVLPAVLMLLALITGLTIQAQLSSRARLARQQHALAHARLRAIAGDAAWNALHYLATNADSLYTHTNADWARPSCFKLPDTTEVSVHVTDATARFNVNNLGVMVLPADLARLPDTIITDLLPDSASPAPVITTRMQNWYIEHQTNTLNSVMYDTDTLLTLMPEIPVPQALELFTVLPLPNSSLTPVNVNTAPLEVLQAILGGTRAWAATGLLHQRMAQPLTLLEHYSGWTAIADCAPYLTVHSSFFEVEATASNAATVATVWAIVECDPTAAWQVRRWVCR